MGRLQGRQSALCGQDANYRKTLKYSAQLKVNVDWCEQAEEAAIDACSELEKAASAAAFPFDLRQGDVLVFDALRWLFSYDAPDDDHDGLCWGPNGWMPRKLYLRINGRARASAAYPPQDVVRRRESVFVSFSG